MARTPSTLSALRQAIESGLEDEAEAEAEAAAKELGIGVDVPPCIDWEE